MSFESENKIVSLAREVLSLEKQKKDILVQYAVKVQDLESKIRELSSTKEILVEEISNLQKKAESVKQENDKIVSNTKSFVDSLKNEANNFFDSKKKEANEIINEANSIMQDVNKKSLSIADDKDKSVKALIEIENNLESSKKIKAEAEDLMNKANERMNKAISLSNKAADDSAKNDSFNKDLKEFEAKLLLKEEQIFIEKNRLMQLEKSLKEDKDKVGIKLLEIEAKEGDLERAFKEFYVVRDAKIKELVKQKDANEQRNNELELGFSMLKSKEDILNAKEIKLNEMMTTLSKEN